MIKTFVKLQLSVIVIFFLLSGCASFSEVSQSKVIEIAKSSALGKGYDISGANIEILKVKDGLEKGPMRLVHTIRFAENKDDIDRFLKKNYWVVYFYPKGLLQGRMVLDGDYTVVIDLYTGDVLLSWPR